MIRKGGWWKINCERREEKRGGRERGMGERWKIKSEEEVRGREGEDDRGREGERTNKSKIQQTTGGGRKLIRASRRGTPESERKDKHEDNNRGRRKWRSSRGC